MVYPNRKVFIYSASLFLIIFGSLISSLQAQNAEDALRYSLRYEIGSINELLLPGSTLGMPSVSAAAVYNPAGLALNQQTALQLGVDYTQNSTDTRYLNNTISADKNGIGLGELGGVYAFPTTQGSLVIGIGYVRSADYRKSAEFGGFNQNHTITDFFNQSSFYGDVAYNAFAIDSVGSVTRSVLRQQAGSFQGVQQDVSRNETGSQGLYSFAIATEFREHLFIGASANIIGGEYDYSRLFIESDPDGRYDGSGATTDFRDMQSQDDINATYSGFTANFGLLYKPIDQFGVGLSYQLPTRLEIDETYAIAIRTRFDNGDEYSDSMDGQQTYKVRYPARFSTGLVLENLLGLKASLRAEYVDYTQTSLSDLGDTFYESGENNYIENNYEAVWNLSGGLGYEVGPVSVSGGVAHYPSPLKAGKPIVDRWVYSGGIQYEVEEGIVLSVAGQYSESEDETVAYQFIEPGSQNVIQSTTSEATQQLRVMLGLKIAI
jgi:opacity protein-like surface antigen